MNADQIARWRVGDSLAPLLRLAATTYPGQELTSEDYLDWQYRRNPDGPVLLHLGSRINASQLSIWLFRILIGSTEHL